VRRRRRRLPRVFSARRSKRHYPFTARNRSRVRLYCFRRFIRAPFQSLRRLTGARASSRRPATDGDGWNISGPSQRRSDREFVIRRDICREIGEARTRQFSRAKLSGEARLRVFDETLSSDGPPLPPNGDLIPGCSLVPAIFTV